MKEIFVTKEYENIRFNKYLQKLLINANTSFIYKMLRKKNILLNDNHAKGTECLKSGDKISIFFKEETYDKFTKNNDTKQEINSDLINKLIENIIYEDDNLLIIDKWDEIKSQSDINNNIAINEICKSYLISKDNNFDISSASIVNRLDTNTVGLIVFAKNYQTSREFSRLFKDRLIDKYYLTEVNGIVSKNEDTIIKYLYKNKNTNTSVISDENISGSSLTKTYYKIIKIKNNSTVLEIKLLTGKSHQIRAVLSSIGHPIICDKKYMDSKLYEENKKKFNMNHQVLISYKLVINNIENDNLKYLNNKMFYSKYKL